MIVNLIFFFTGGIVGFFAAALCAAASKADLMWKNEHLRAVLGRKESVRLKPKPRRKNLHPAVSSTLSDFHVIARHEVPKQSQQQI